MFVTTVKVKTDEKVRFSITVAIVCRSKCQKWVSKSVILAAPDKTNEAYMRQTHQNGFSLVELLCVLVIVGILAAVAVPSLTKGIRAAETGAVFSTMRTISSSQVSLYTAKGRFGRLDEINNLVGDGVGRPVGPNQLSRNRFVIEMVPPVPTDPELKDGYTVIATRRLADEAQVYKFELTQTGEIRQVLP